MKFTLRNCAPYAKYSCGTYRNGKYKTNYETFHEVYEIHGTVQEVRHFTSQYNLLWMKYSKINRAIWTHRYMTSGPIPKLLLQNSFSSLKSWPLLSSRLSTIGFKKGLIRFPSFRAITSQCSHLYTGSQFREWLFILHWSTRILYLNGKRRVWRRIVLSSHVRAWSIIRRTRTINPYRDI